MKIPFSLPVLDQDVIDEMYDTLTRTGWITSGPKTLALEQEIRKFTGTDAVICVNSWTSGAMLMLRWFGVGPGDEVIIPAYTYAATALAALNLGARPVMVDVGEDFNINPENIGPAITERTKAIIPVDLGGWPCNYEKIYQVINEPANMSKFVPASDRQKQLGRILVLADAAHSLGGEYKNLPVGKAADVTIFSLHSVKNITTGEGGAICLSLPSTFEPQDEYKFLKVLSLNGQTKSALEKNQPGGWRYDIIEMGLKVNMPDLCATVGLAQIRKYKSTLLPERKRIFDYYNTHLGRFDWAILPKSQNGRAETSYHLYLLRIRDFSEDQRNELIRLISEKEVGVNVHYIPLPQLTLFRNLGYRMEDYPVTYKLYQNEITLPVYNGLSEDKLSLVVQTLVEAYNEVISSSKH